MNTVESILKDKLNLQGQMETVRGFLVADFDLVFLYNSKAEINSKNYIRITDCEFINICINNIPCYGGGPFIYYDNVIISGILNINFENNSTGEITINKVISLRVERLEKIYEINF